MALLHTLDWERPGDCGPSQFPPVPWRLDATTFPAGLGREPAVRCSQRGEPVRSGSRSVRFELRKGDRAIRDAVPPRGGLERAEMEQTGLASWAPVPSERWYGFSIYLPTDWVSDPSPEIVTQWHQEAGVGGPPPLSIVTRNGEWWIVQRKWGQNDTVYHPAGPCTLGSWTDWVVHVRWAGSDDPAAGLLQVWKNGQPVPGFTAKQGRTAEDPIQGNRYTYMKIGIYKWDWFYGNPSNTTTRVMFHDEVKIAEGSGSYNEVAPQGIGWIPPLVQIPRRLKEAVLHLLAALCKRHSWPLVCKRPR
jgi:hypothetical protein